MWLALALAVLCAIAVARTAAAAAPATTVVVFSPWSSGGLRAEYAVSGKAHGDCWTHSLSTDRPDAWRCAVGNEIYDPCFAGKGSKTLVACAQDPFKKRVLLVSLAKPLVDGDPATAKMLQPEGEAWGLKLSSGEQCSLATGATDVVAGDRMNYECNRGSWVIGFPNRSTALWTARTIVWPNKSRIKKAGVATAVF